MGTVPDAYYRFVVDYAPYVYVVPESGPDLSWGRAAFAAAFAVDFLFEAYFDPEFDDRSMEIEAKIVALADWMLTQQCTDNSKQAYGGFKSSENSQEYYSVDACRTIPALLKAYELTSNQAYLNIAKLAVGTFLYNMQHAPSQVGVHDRYYGGFARAVTLSGAWLSQMDVECLYGLAALKMLREMDAANRDTYETMILDAVEFYRAGLEGRYLFFDASPSGDAAWHRTGIADDTVFDDSVAYALVGLYAWEGWSSTVQKTYSAINGIGASPLYPAYNPAVCWAGYINVAGRLPACDYYDCVTAGILARIRRDHDKPAYDYSAKTVNVHSGEFMFWGAKHADYAFVEEKQAMATVCWLAQLCVVYESPVTRFTQILNSKGETLTLYPVASAGERAAYGEGVAVKAIVLPAKAEEVLLEPGYVASEHIVLHVFAPVRCRVPGENALMQLTKDTLEFGAGGSAAPDVYLKRVADETVELKADALKPAGDDVAELGSDEKRFKGLYAAGAVKVGWLNVDAYTVITNARVLQNVTADAAMITGGQFPLARLPRGTSGCVLEAQGTGYDPMYVDPNGRYAPAGHTHAAGDVTSGTLAEARLPNVYAGQVTFQGGIVTNSVNCANWQLADAIFANGFRITEAEKLGYSRGLAFLNEEGSVLMVLTEKGDFHVKGKLEALKVKTK